MQSSSEKPREGERATVGLIARYRNPTTFEYVEEQCTDVSLGGMFVRSQAPAAVGTLLRLECTSAPDALKLQCVGRVVWHRATEGAAGPSGMGVKFVQLEGSSLAAIEDLVQRMSHPDVAPPSYEDTSSSLVLASEVMTVALAPQTMTLAEAADIAEPLPDEKARVRDSRTIWAATLGGLGLFMFLMVQSARRVGDGEGSLGIIISEAAAAEAAALHRERLHAPALVSSTPRSARVPPSASVAVAPPPDARPPDVEAAPSMVPVPVADAPRPAAKAPSSARPQYKPKPTAKGAPAAARAPAAASPMAAATACLQQGDNACVITALQGRAKTAHEFELLIETQRAASRAADARANMRTYVQRFPDERLASTYRRLLSTQKDAAASPAVATEPQAATTALSETAPPSSPSPTEAAP